MKTGDYRSIVEDRDNRCRRTETNQPGGTMLRDRFETRAEERRFSDSC